jgi:hypothetical protein
MLGRANVFPQLATPVASYCGGIAMTLIRRQLLQVAGALAVVPALT